MSNIYRIIEAKKLIEFTIFKIYIKFIENVQKIIQDRGLDLNVVDLESNDNPNNYIIFSRDGKELYIDPTSQKRTLHTQYEPGFIEARDKSPLELLIENKDLLD